MAKPRIFLSSTFYDLRQIRSDLDLFLENMGYEPIRNEEGDIPYGKDDSLEEYCYKEISSIDILISIIGGRYGSESKGNNASISQMELKTALKQDKQIYIFIERNVLAEYETYLINKDNSTMNYKYVDDKRIYTFIEEIKNLSANNNIKGFESASEIIKYIREQFAGLFQRFLEEQTRIKEINLIKGLEKTSETLNKLVNFLAEENNGHTEEINRILMINHPLVQYLRAELNIPYNFYIEGLLDLNQLLDARGYKELPEDIYSLTTVTYGWIKTRKGKKIILRISKSLFDDSGSLKYIKKAEWSDNYIELLETDLEKQDSNLQ